jgi:multiple sugar transport system substrate-binding protein
MFAAGKMAMVIAPNQLPTYLFDKGSKVNFKTAVIPCNEGAANGSTGIMDRVMAFRDDSYPDQARRNAAIGKFLSFFYSKEVYTGWVSMEGFLPAVSSAVADLAAADPSFSAWLAVLDSCQFYPTAKAEWNDVKQGVIKVEQNALQGGDVKALLDELQAKVSK